MVYIPEALIEEIEELKDLGKFDEAIQIIGSEQVKRDTFSVVLQ